MNEKLIEKWSNSMIERLNEGAHQTERGRVARGTDENNVYHEPKIDVCRSHHRVRIVCELRSNSNESILRCEGTEDPLSKGYTVIAFKCHVMLRNRSSSAMRIINLKKFLKSPRQQTG